MKNGLLATLSNAYLECQYSLDAERAFWENGSKKEKTRAQLESSAAKKKLEFLARINRQYYTFSHSLLRDVISRLISEVEKEKYIPAFVDDWDLTALAVIKEDKKTENVSSRVQELQESDDRIIFKVITSEEFEQDIDHEKISIYDIEPYNFDFLIDCGKFTYVKDFLDQLIEYSYSKKKALSDIEMYGFLGKYLLENPDLSSKESKTR